MLMGLARPVLDGVEGIEAALGQQSALPVGLVRVGVTVATSRFLSLRLPSLLIDHPRLKVELVVGDRVNDLIEDRLDFAMRAGEITDASLVVRRSGTAMRVVVAAPTYVKLHGEPSSPAELANHILPLCTTLEGRIRTYGLLSLGRVPRDSGCPADFSPTMGVRHT